MDDQRSDNGFETPFEEANVDTIEMVEGREPRDLFKIIAGIYAAYGGYRAFELAPQTTPTATTEWLLASLVATLAIFFAVGLMIRADWALAIGLLMAVVSASSSTVFFLNGREEALPSIVWSIFLFIWMVEPVLQRMMNGGISEQDLPWWAIVRPPGYDRDYGLEMKISLIALIALLIVILIVIFVLTR